MRDMLDIWPEFPISIEDDGDATVEGATNVVNALKLNDRVSRIKLWNVSSSEVKLERVVEVMQDPFPTLTYLLLLSSDVTPPVISDSFLGGSAPRLQNLWLDGIPFPTLPNLLFSAPDLVHLRLWRVPHSGYISPETMVSCLSALTRLEEFVLGFQSPRSRPFRTDRLRRPLTRTILPALTQLRYKGVTEYLEDLVARIDIPLLQEIEMTFFNQLVFDISQLPKFVTHTATIATLDQADVVFYNSSISIELSSQTATVDPAKLTLRISCRQLDWQLSSLAQVCNSTLATPSTLDRLDIHEDRHSPPHWQDDIETTQWLELFHPFTSVKNLHLSKQVTPCVAPALKELPGERVTEVLPALQNLFIDGFQPSGPDQEAFGGFVAARQLSGCPVTIHHWERRK